MLTEVKNYQSAPVITVHNPVGYPPKISRKQPAPRLSSLDGKTIYLVDSRFDDSIELLKQVQIWFAEKMPGVKTELRSMASYYGKDDPELWTEIKTRGHAAIIGVGHCSTCAPAVSTHAITLETQYGVPTVAIHTDKFVKVVQSVTRMGGLAQAPVVYVPQPVMGKTEGNGLVNDYTRGYLVLSLKLLLAERLGVAPEAVGGRHRSSVWCG